jgi:4'-phosphopantetheinyl transferase EntD
MTWRYHLLHGLCTAIPISPRLADVRGEELSQLHPQERELALQFSPRRRCTWVGGRLALAAAFRELGIDSGPVLSSRRGAPVVPPGVAASLSHKRNLYAVALVAKNPGGDTVGVDIEPLWPCRAGITPWVLTDAEQAHVNAMPVEERWPETLMRFCIKEALYKALDPWLCRDIGFHDVEVVRGADDKPAIRLHPRAGEGSFAVDVDCERPAQGLVLATARVRSLMR